MTSRFIAFGMLFGFVLSRVDATSYDAIHGMFRLSDLHLVGVIGVAIAIAAAGFALFKRAHIPEAKVIKPKPMKKGLVIGGLLFGAGWGLGGICPGPAIVSMAMVPSPALAAWVASMVVGMYVNKRVLSKVKTFA